MNTAMQRGLEGFLHAAQRVAHKGVMTHVRRKTTGETSFRVPLLERHRANRLRAFCEGDGANAPFKKINTDGFSLGVDD